MEQKTWNEEFCESWKFGQILVTDARQGDDSSTELSIWKRVGHSQSAWCEISADVAVTARGGASVHFPEDWIEEGPRV